MNARHELVDPVIDRSNEPVTWGNRLFSLVGIGLVWLLVRLVSELNGTGWEKAFWGTAVIVCAYPMTASLTLAAFAKTRDDQSWYRWFAIVGCFVLFWAMGFMSEIPVLKQTLKEHYAAFLVVSFQIAVLVVSRIIYNLKFRKGVR